MSIIERNQVAEPVLPKETVTVASLDGDVIVRGLLLSEQMALAARVHRASQPLDGETDEQAGIRARSARVAETLAQTVILADDQPLWSAQKWDIFGAKHPADALALFEAAGRLNGDDVGAVGKN